MCFVTEFLKVHSRSVFFDGFRRMRFYDGIYVKTAYMGGKKYICIYIYIFE